MQKFIPDKLFNSKSAEKSFGFRRVTNLTVLIVSLGLLFAACDDDPAGPDEDPGDGSDPVEVEASFTMDPENPITGDEVTLDASSSSVTDNGDLSYSWALTPPTGSGAELINTDEVNTSFTADEAGDYDVELTVSANGETDETSKTVEVSAEEEISADITEDRTFRSDITYIVTRSIDIEAILTIEPGTTIFFEPDTDLQVRGTAAAVIADGTEEDPILFTSTVEQPGAWNGIYVRSSENQNNRLNWVTVEYGGGNDFRNAGPGNVIVGRGGDASSIDITNSTLRYSESYGLRVNNISDVPTFENNTITENEDAPANMSAINVHRLDAASSFKGNDSDYIRVRSGSGHTINDNDVTWENLDVDYRIVGGDGIEIQNNVTLTIEPGATLEFDPDSYIELQEQGGLVADGTEAEPIVFTGTTEQAGWWNGIYVRESTNPDNRLNWVTVEYGGGDSFRNSGSGNVIVGRDASFLDITNSTIKDSSSDGLWVNSNSTVNDDACDVNTFENNSGGDCVIN